MRKFSLDHRAFAFVASVVLSAFFAVGIFSIQLSAQHVAENAPAEVGTALAPAIATGKAMGVLCAPAYAGSNATLEAISCETGTPEPTATEIPTSTEVVTETKRPTETATPFPTITNTPLPTVTKTKTPVPPTATQTPSATHTATATPTASATPTVTASATAEPTTTASATPTAAHPSATPTTEPPTVTPSPAPSETPTPTVTPNPSPTPSETSTPTPTPSATPSPTPVTPAPPKTQKPPEELEKTTTVNPIPAVSSMESLEGMKFMGTLTIQNGNTFPVYETFLDESGAPTLVKFGVVYYMGGFYGHTIQTTPSAVNTWFSIYAGDTVTFVTADGDTQVFTLGKGISQPYGASSEMPKSGEVFFMRCEASESEWLGTIKFPAQAQVATP